MRTGTQTEEEARDLKAEVERLQWELVRHREKLAAAEADRRKAGADAASWRRKILALAEHYRKRIRQLALWSERLSRERATLERERRRLEETVGRLTAERESLRQSLARFRCEALSWFLGGALEEAPSGESVRRLNGGGERDRRILSLLSRRGSAEPRSAAARTGS